MHEELSEAETDAILEKYTARLVTQSLPTLGQNVDGILPDDEAVVKRFLGDCFFFLLFVVSDLVISIDSEENLEERQVPLGEDLRKRLTSSFFEGPRIYRVMHQRLEDDPRSWDELDPVVRKNFKFLYRKISFITYCALVYWSGGYTSERVAKLTYLK